MVGQDAVVETLRNAVRLDRLTHGLLFVGPRGTGKTSTARILAKAVNCPDLRSMASRDDACPSCVAIREGRALDVVELDAASNNRVDDMRELVPRVYTAAADLRRKVFIIDEVQRIKEGWDVLLKTLEEPPHDVLFIFCTTDPVRIRPGGRVAAPALHLPAPARTTRSRASSAHRRSGRTRRSADDALALIAQLAAGGMRDAESMLDQVLGGVERHRRRRRARPAGPGRPETPSSGSSTRSRSGDALDGIRCSTSWRARAGPRRLRRAGRRRACASGS